MGWFECWSYEHLGDSGGIFSEVLKNQVVEVHISCILIRGTFVASIEGGGEGVGGDYRCTHCTPMPTALLQLR